MKERRRSSTPYVVVAVLLVVVAAWAAAGRARRKPPKAEAVPGVPVEVATVTLGEMAETVPVTGTLRADREAAMHAQVAARVTSVAVREGDPVVQGQVLVTLDPTDYQAQVRQAQAAVESSQATARNIRAQSLAAQKRLQVVEAGARTEEREMAASHLEQAEAALRQAQANLKRREQLFEKGAISREELDTAQTAYDTARTTRDAARQQQQLTEKGARPEEVEAAQAEANAAHQAVSAAEAGIQQANAALARAQQLLSYTTIRAPISGVIYDRKVEPGEITSTIGDPILKVADLTSVYFEATVPGRLAPQVQAGQTVQLSFRADGAQRHEGRVLKLVPVANPSSRDFLARVSVPKVSGLSRPGQYAEGQIVISRRQSIPIVSKDALTERNGRPVVFVVRGGTAQQRAVHVGLTDAARAEITSGLRAGEVVVSAGQQTLQDGSKVAVQQSGGD